MPYQISDELVSNLLDKLSSDDEFRRVFQKNPRIALAYLGHEGATNAGPKDAGIWGCAQCQQLATKEAIGAARATLKAQLLETLAVYKVVGLDAAN